MNEIDRELLELAAKAVGLQRCERYYTDATGNHVDWNPLADDGDALRLAVKLNIVVWECAQYNCALVEIRYGHAPGELTEPVVDDDPYAATRRAIVRAAAEIGKGFDV